MLSGKKPVIVIGAGGHAKVVINLLLELQNSIEGITCLEKKLFGKKILSRPILGNDSVIFAKSTNEILLANGVGDNHTRAEIFTTYKKHGYSFATLIHPFSYLGLEIELGEGVQIMAGCVIQPGCKLGENSIINSSASVDHDCHIGKHVHISPGAKLCGDVRIGDGVHIGAGAILIPGVTVGAHSLIGAGTVVLKDVPEKSKLVGNPGRFLSN